MAYLAHHGILGQKWGVRRYQNKDGSLTPAGQKRYAKELSKKNMISGPSWVENDRSVYNVRQAKSYNDAKRMYVKKAEAEKAYGDLLDKAPYDVDDDIPSFAKKLNMSVDDVQDIIDRATSTGNAYLILEKRVVSELLGKYGDVNSALIARNGIRSSILKDLKKPGR